MITMNSIEHIDLLVWAKAKWEKKSPLLMTQTVFCHSTLKIMLAFIVKIGVPFYEKINLIKPLLNFELINYSIILF